LHQYVQDGDGKKLILNGILNPHRQRETTAVAQAIRELICTDGLADLLQSVDGASSHTIHQTLIFFTSPGTELHCDGWGLDSYPFGYSHTLWIPLEPVRLVNGPLAIVPWTVGRFLSPQELGFGDDFLERKDKDRGEGRTDYHEYFRRLDAHIRLHHPDTVVPQLDPGDFVMFSSLTPHRTMPPDVRTLSRSAMQIMLRDSGRTWAAWPQLLLEQRANGPDDPADGLDAVNARWRIVM
jgi:ectoine hydroxylase-related dioxygenase (phytanoyl-CoA dioxygenase family)